MTVLLAGVGLFVATLVIHVVMWRIRVPRQQAATLIFLILVAGFVGTAVLFTSRFQGLDGLKPLLAIGVFGSLSAIYLILFSSLEADSPTLTILNLVHASGAQGIEEGDLRTAMARQSYVRKRINQLLQDGMVIEVSDRLRLQPRGQLFCKFVLYYRKLLRRNNAGG